VSVGKREAFAHVAADAIAHNVYLFCAGNGLATVIRAWIDREAISAALGCGMTSKSCCRRPSAIQRHEVPSCRMGLRSRTPGGLTSLNCRRLPASTLERS
jgi:hypothetical protein